MEGTTRDRATGKGENQAVDNVLLMNSKPLHRFVQKEPRSLGIVIMIFGCAEVLMGFQLAQVSDRMSSHGIYIPFWQGALFIVCGNLSIYTEIHPSKKMLTVCLAMYVVSLLGIVVSVGYRIYLLSFINFMRYRRYSDYDLNQILSIEVVLFTSSLCVSVLLIFLSTVARLALKSTQTQVIVQHIPPPLTNTTSN